MGGRMEKFYWNPTRQDRIGVAYGIFKPDGVSKDDVEQIIDRYPNQSIDFFGAMRARVYDDKVVFEAPEIDLQTLITYGDALRAEQDNVQKIQLADAYLEEAAFGETEAAKESSLLA